MGNLYVAGSNNIKISKYGDTLAGLSSIIQPMYFFITNPDKVTFDYHLIQSHENNVFSADKIFYKLITQCSMKPVENVMLNITKAPLILSLCFSCFSCFSCFCLCSKIL